MRETFTLISFLLAILLWGCDGSKIDADERDQMVKRFAEEYYLNNAPANNGYEFVELTVIDTISYKDNIDYRKKFIQDKIDYHQKMLGIAQQKQDSFPTVNFTQKTKEYQLKVTQYTQVLAGIDSLENVLGDRVNDVASYTYWYKLKANNAEGKRELKEYYLQTDAGFGVLRFVSSPEELFPNPNDFPGYHDMAAAILVEP